MTTERARWQLQWWGAVLLGAAGALAWSCAGTSSVRYGDHVDVSRYPADIQEAYAVFAVRCSRCHTLARPLNARITDPEHWVRYVTRMRRTPGSGINPADAEIILRFLLYYTKQVAAEDEGAVGAPPESDVIGGGRSAAAPSEAESPARESAPPPAAADEAEPRAPSPPASIPASDSQKSSMIEDQTEPTEERAP